MDKSTHQFVEGSKFTDITDLYFFDKQLRALLFSAIQTIEIAVRTKIIKHFAHTYHSRLLNRVFPIKPQMPVKMPGIWIKDFSFKEQTLYPQLCYIVYWLNSISANNTFVADFKRLLSKHPSVNTNMLGFPINWEKEPLWKEE